MGIAHELITRGWTQGVFQAEDGAVCIRGALMCSVSEDWFYGRITKAEAEEVHRREDVLWKLLNGTEPAAWNDLPERIFDEVLRVAKEADEILGAS